MIDNNILLCVGVDAVFAKGAVSSYIICTYQTSLTIEEFFCVQ